MKKNLMINFRSDENIAESLGFISTQRKWDHLLNNFLKFERKNFPQKEFLIIL